MRIHKIQITDFKAFRGRQSFEISGKNIFIYGENGSGKSSFYYALKDFFQSSSEDIDLGQLQNIFVKKPKDADAEAPPPSAAVTVTFKPNPQTGRGKKTYRWQHDRIDARAADDTSIRDANKLKSFLTYKHLLAIHHIKGDQEIDLFDLLVNGVLKHFKYTLTEGKELGELWQDVQRAIARHTGRTYPIDIKRREVKAALKSFNQAFDELFKEDSPEFILKHAKHFLAYFNNNLQIKLSFSQLKPSDDDSALIGGQVRIKLKYADQDIDKPHMFLNEARLSAIAISIYLGMIKRHIQGMPCKVLFLDDIFIGLDIANRMPLLEILDKEFDDYQIFVTTYDKPWFEHARNYLDQTPKWKTIEFYSQTSADGIEFPKVIDGRDLLHTAKGHLQNCDYKAAAVYARSAFEKLIRKYCEKKHKPVAFRERLRDYTTESFWAAIKGDLDRQLCDRIETYRPLVLNAFSHYNTERHEIRCELEKAIQAIEDLKAALESLSKSKTVVQA